MLNVVIFGAPGSGKGTQSELIIKEFGLDHISTGEILRAEIQNKTELGIIAGQYINKRPSTGALTGMISRIAPVVPVP